MCFNQSITVISFPIVTFSQIWPVRVSEPLFFSSLSGALAKILSSLRHRLLYFFYDCPFFSGLLSFSLFWDPSTLRVSIVLFCCRWHSVWWIRHGDLCIHSPVDGCLGRVSFVAVWNKDSTNNSFLWPSFSFLWDKGPRLWWLAYVTSVCLTF